MTVQPEQMSLSAHQHIQNLKGNSALAGDDLTAVLRLSQHLRVFGLLSAVGYVNQSNAQEGEVRKRTAPVWESLLGQLLDEKTPPKRVDLMNQVVEMAKNEPALYMETWRRSLVLANHWNFWARAYQEGK
jgi:glucan phosphorylase